MTATTDKKIITPEDAAAELLKRRAARTRFVDYVEYVSHTTAPRHSRLLCKYLDMCIERKITRLMVFMPPGAAKSFYISRHFPAYYLARFPDHSVIAATHTDDFANQWGRKVKNVIESEEHLRLFPGSSIAEDSRASGRWETNAGGEYNAAGVGGNITGRRANLAVIDDPLRGIEDANSKTVRDKQWDWYGADLTSRVKKDGLIIIVQTRWHLDDLSGRLIAAQQQGGEKFTILSLPAIAEKNDPLKRKIGEALWPEEYPIERLLAIKQQPSMTGRMWASLYAQSPIADAGNIVKRSWVRIWAQADPPTLSLIIQSWDTAITKSEDSAWSVCLTIGIFQEPETGLPAAILLSRWRARVHYPELRKAAQRLAKDYLDPCTDDFSGGANRPPGKILVEDKATGKPLIADLARAGVQATAFNPNRYGTKEARLNLVLDIIENGRFYVPGMKPTFTQPKKWADDFISNLCAFPAAEARDDVDALSQALIHVKMGGWVPNTNDPSNDEVVYRERVAGAIY